MGSEARKKRKASPKRKSSVDAPDTRASNTAEIIGLESDAARMVAADASPISMGVSGEERHQLIAEAAYFRAERRNFAPGNELEDWLDAESEIEMMLSKTALDNPPRST